MLLPFNACGVSCMPQSYDTALNIQGAFVLPVFSEFCLPQQENKNKIDIPKIILSQYWKKAHLNFVNTNIQLCTWV